MLFRSEFFGELDIGGVYEVDRAYVNRWEERDAPVRVLYVELVGFPGASYRAENFELIYRPGKAESEQ